MTELTTEKREATIVRTFDAPRELVWSCLTEPELFSQWFDGPPFSTPADRISMDVRPGGRMSATMVNELDGSEITFAGEFRDVDEPSRLVQTLEDSTGVEVLTTTLEDLGEGRTRATYHQTGNLPPEEYANIETGVHGFYDRLEALLTRLQRG